MTAMGFVIPGDINRPTGGYTYDRRVLALFSRYGVEARHVVLPATFPFPAKADLEATERTLAALPADMVLLIDGLAFGALPAELVARIRQPIVALVHHPLYLETGLAHEQQRHLHLTEKSALTFARAVVAVSSSTRDELVGEFAVPAERITLANPGTDPAPRAKGTGTPLQIVSVGSVIPRKAYDVLVRALAALPPQGWRLTIAGAYDRTSEAYAALTHALAQTGLADRVSLLGALPGKDLDEIYDHADVFVLASLHEGYGMVIAEAMARGLPIVCTTGGAAADTAPDEAALKVPPKDVEALGAALARVATDAGLRKRMAEASWVAGQKLARWEDTARIIAGVVKKVAGEHA